MDQSSYQKYLKYKKKYSDLKNKVLVQEGNGRFITKAEIDTSPVQIFLLTLTTDELAKIWILHTKNWVGHKELSKYYEAPYPTKINPILGPNNLNEFVSFPTKNEFKNYLSETFTLKGIRNLMEKIEVYKTAINSEGWLIYVEHLKTWWSQNTQPGCPVKRFSEEYDYNLDGWKNDDVQKILNTISTDQLAKMWILHTRNWVSQKHLAKYYQAPYPAEIDPMLGPDNANEFLLLPTEIEFRNYLLAFSSRFLNSLIKQIEEFSEGWLKYVENLKTWWKQPVCKPKTFSEVYLSN